MNELKAGYRVLVDATITNVDIEHGKYYVRVSDHGIWMKEDKVHSIDTATKTYEDGLREAWDLARRISSGKEHGGFDLGELEEIFKASTRAEVFRKFTPQKAADCVALREAQKENEGGEDQ